MFKKLRKFFHIHVYHFHHRDGANVYCECRCGKRGCYSTTGGYSPIYWEWLNFEQKHLEYPCECYGYNGWVDGECICKSVMKKGATW